MPDYGTLPADQGTGLLPWSAAVERFHASKNLWVATVWPDGRPHLSAVWGVWLDDAAWFSCGLHSRKLINLRAEPRCVVSADDSDNQVVIDGVAEIVADRPAIRRFLDALNEKYQSGITEDFLDPGTNASVRVVPRTAFGMLHDDFSGSPTRWEFGADTGS
jgi:PPOX class probable F420-dependent enzyme